MAAEDEAVAEGGSTAQVDATELARALKPLASETRIHLLNALVAPLTIEEAGERVGITRQAAQPHLDQLVDVGVVRKQAGRRASGPVTEYVVVPPRLFVLTERFSQIGNLRVAGEEGALARTEDTSQAPGAVSASVRPALVIVHGLHVGRDHPLDRRADRWGIGRDERQDVCLDYDPFVSNRHAEVVRDGDGYRLTDTFSTNGTFLNWTRLPRGENVPLASGDVIGIGKSLIVLQA